MSGRGSPQSVESGTNSDDNTNNTAPKPKLKGWGAVAGAVLEVNPMAKVNRLINAIARLCTTPEMLGDASEQLVTMLSHQQLQRILSGASAHQESDLKVNLCVAVTDSMSSVEMASFLEKRLRTMEPATRLALLEPELIDLPDLQRAALIPTLIDHSKDEMERLRIVKQVLEWRPHVNLAASRTVMSRQQKNEMVSVDNLRAIDLAHSDRLLDLLVQQWGDQAVDRVTILMNTLPAQLCKRACGQILASGSVDALQLEQALELIYNKEEEDVGNNPLAASELQARRRESAVARNMLREGHAPKLLANSFCVGPADSEDGEEGWCLTCDCTRKWVIPNSLLGKLKGEKGEGAAPLSIRRFEDVRFETANEKRSKKAKRRTYRSDLRMIMRDGLMVPETNFITIKAEDDGKDQSREGVVDDVNQRIVRCCG